MIGLQIKLNNSILSIAGEEGNKLIACDISISFDPKRPHRDAHTTLNVFGGNGDKELKTWVDFANLKVGDKVSLKVIETDKVDEPISRRNISE